MSTFGQLFRVTTYGESHGKSVGCVIDNCPPGLPLSEDDIQPMLSRRRPGQTKFTTPRDEKDKCFIQAGVELGKTLGSPICIMVNNEDQRPHDYSETDLYPRPSHSDYTYLSKYGLKASSGGGRSSARETIGRCAAGAVAEKFLQLACNVEIVAFVSKVGEIGIETELCREIMTNIKRKAVDLSDIRCPCSSIQNSMKSRILKAKEAQDSIGGIVTCVIRNCPIGLGEPCFDKLEAKLAHAMLSIPATKGFEIGSGFAGVELPGSVHNDTFIRKQDGTLGTTTNNSGGIQGGISNGEDIYFQVAFKSPATISKNQKTCTYDGESGSLEARGRHDPCVVPRAVPIVESMAALVIMDAYLIQKSRESAKATLM